MSRIEWVRNGLGGERGRINGNDVFHLTYPGDWSDHFCLTSPLIFMPDRHGWLGAMEVADPGPETTYSGDKRPSRTQIVKDFEADRERWQKALDVTKALAEALLVDFAKSVLQGVDEPS